MGKPEGNRPIGRPSRSEDNIEMDLAKLGCDGMEWISLY
jgi:hypothetical protein